MQKCFTQESLPNTEVKSKSANNGPKAVTLQIIRQFAHAYNYESKLEAQLGNIVAN